MEEKQLSKQVAIKMSKRKYDNLCMLSNKTNPDGCHIFPCDNYPSLRNYPSNIVPLDRWYHSHKGNKNHMDSHGGIDRTPEQRIQWVFDNVHEPINRSMFRVQILILARVLKTEGVKIDFDLEGYGHV